MVFLLKQQNVSFKLGTIQKRTLSLVHSAVYQVKLQKKHWF